MTWSVERTALALFGIRLRTYPVFVVAAVALATGGCADSSSPTTTNTTTIDVPETGRPTTALAAVDPTTTSVPPTTSDASTLPPRDPARQALQVTTAELNLDEERADLLDGMVLGVHLEFVWEDGAGGSVPVPVRVEEREALIVRGRWCGFAWVPPLDDLAGGTVASGGRPGVHRCTPGADVAEIRLDNAYVADTALINGRPTLALLYPDRVELVDLDTAETRILAPFDPSVESPIAASYGGGRWLISISESSHAPQPTRYILLDGLGVEQDVAARPRHGFGERHLGHGPAALSPDGSFVVYPRHLESGASDLVVWDIENGVRIQRHRVIEKGTEWGRFGPDYVGALDASTSAILVNVSAHGAEDHPKHVLRLDLDSRVLTELDLGLDHATLSMASFLEAERSEQL